MQTEDRYILSRVAITVLVLMVVAASLIVIANGVT
jgi:hypothetical protein